MRLTRFHRSIILKPVPCGVKKDPVMQLKPSNWCITAAMKTQITTMIFNRKHQNHALKYFKPIATLSWDDH